MSPYRLPAHLRRHQPPAYSPLSGRSIGSGVGQLLRVTPDPRPVLADILGRQYAADSVVLCGSGTQALTLAIREATRFVDSGAPVALPAFCCFDVASAAVGANGDGRLSFYDLDPGTLAPDLASLTRVLKWGARIVVVAPLYGVPIDWPELEAVVEEYGGVLIEDAAQGQGAAWNGRAVGSLARLSVLSFGRGKGWTGGNGGALLARRFERALPELPDPDLRSEARTAAALVAQWGFARPSTFAIPLMIPGLNLGETVYRPPMPVRRLGRVAAASLIASHDAAVREGVARRANAQRLRGALANAGGMRFIRPPAEGLAGYLRLPALVADRKRRFPGEAGIRALGVAPSYPITLPSLPAIAKKIGGPEARWPGAEELVTDLLTLPTHSRLEDQDFIALENLFRGTAPRRAVAAGGV